MCIGESKGEYPFQIFINISPKSWGKIEKSLLHILSIVYYYCLEFLCTLNSDITHLWANNSRKSKFPSDPCIFEGEKVQLREGSRMIHFRRGFERTHISFLWPLIMTIKMQFITLFPYPRCNFFIVQIHYFDLIFKFCFHTFDIFRLDLLTRQCY